jgi:hypothetical protein
MKPFIIFLDKIIPWGLGTIRLRKSKYNTVTLRGNSPRYPIVVSKSSHKGTKDAYTRGNLSFALGCH